MVEQPKLIEHHDWPTSEEHLFGPWQEKGQSEKYRTCVYPGCKYTEVRKISNF